MAPPKQQSGEIPVHLTSQELQFIELRRWLEIEFREIKNDMKEDRDVLHDVHDRVTKIEIKQEYEDKGLISKRPKTEATSNPLNKSVGSLLGDVVVTALKTAGVAAVSALLLIGYDMSRKEKQQPPTYTPPPQPKGTQP